MYEQPFLPPPPNSSPSNMVFTGKARRLRPSDAITIFRATMELRKQAALRKHEAVCRKAI